MADELIIQDLRDRLIKIETLLEQKFVITDIKTKELEERIKKLEENQTWLWRAVVGAVITGAIAFLIGK
ncbi:hemolysin XhlA family protein [Clostridium sp. SYSU_GA19001]|uniref:hemolysin XhlA family protein n=1 Tax=Clostridium caldaquaticum TaxID=2940653 RepID=UPI0020771FC0|nr:hemolysin XhlA family protein [Clostridium caldaquaticum]MCM8710552.1 hemolysin XhlA family protein [Clostridium caldaquaticum]